MCPGGGGATGVTHNETCYCGAKGMGGLVTLYFAQSQGEVMSTLRQFLFGYAEEKSSQELAVYNTSHNFL